MGHLVLFNLKKIVCDQYRRTGRKTRSGARTIPPMAEVADQVHDQGGLVSWAHFDYPSGELTTDVALGKIDAVDLLTVGNPLRRDPVHAAFYDMLYVRLHQMSPVEVYYTLLNSGFRIPVSAGSDKMGNFVPMGSARVYVNMEGPLTYKKWVEGIKLGKTFVTSGPMIYLTVNGKGIGDTITVTPGQLREGKYVASVEARAESREPYRFERLELIVNGQVPVKCMQPSGGQKPT